MSGQSLIERQHIRIGHHTNPMSLLLTIVSSSLSEERQVGMIVLALWKGMKILAHFMLFVSTSSK